MRLGKLWRAGLIGLVVLAAAGLAAIAVRAEPPCCITPVAVFGKDDRRLVPKTLSRLESQIGLLFNDQSRVLCTAFCVAPDVIATAAHCFYRPEGQRGNRFEDYWFATHIDDAPRTSRIKGHASRSAEAHVAVGTTRLRVLPPIDAGKDWALARLDAPVCAGGFFPLTPKPLWEVTAAADAKRFYQLSYHYDFKRWRVAYSTPCRIRSDFQRSRLANIRKQFSDPDILLLHDCDTGGASSGSPLLMETNQGVVAVGINVGSYEETDVVMQGNRVVRNGKSRTLANTGISASVLAAALPAVRSAEVLTERNALMRLQTALAGLRLYGGAIDGAFGPATRGAIMAYEGRLGGPVLGMPTARLLAQLTGTEDGAANGETVASRAKALGSFAPSSAGTVVDR